MTDLKTMQDRYVRTCQRLGLIPEGFHLEFEKGSAYNGIAYQVHLTGDRVNGEYPNGSGLARPPLGNAFLGRTAKEAQSALYERCDTAYDMARIK